MYKLFSLLPNSLSQRITACYFRLRAWRSVGNRGSHSYSSTVTMSGYSVDILPALEDNYMYLLVCNETNYAAIVDPVEPEKVFAAIQKRNALLQSVITTHHHWDHAGGNQKLVSQFSGPLKVFGGDDRIEALTDKVQHNDVFYIGKLKVTCLYTPCHTTGHFCYFVQAPSGEMCVFTGDTLFSAGCGRFFEGTPDQMYSSLISTLSALPSNTQVYFGHEYTLANLAFARHVEPYNETILNKIKSVQQLREQFLPTAPSSIGEEKEINPFMRVNVASVRQHAGNFGDGIQTMAFLRNEKDSFKA